MDAQTEKKTLRKEVKRRLSGMQAGQIQAASASLRRHLEQWKQWHGNQILMAFCPMEREPDLIPLLQKSINTGHQVGLVRMTTDTPTILEVRLWNGSLADLEPQRGLRLRQPGAHLPLIHPGTYQGTILIPGLAFDSDGRRLGHGQGWYDRFLYAWPDLIRVGVCFATQMMPTMAQDPWDQNMDFVANEEGIFPAQRNS